MLRSIVIFLAGAMIGAPVGAFLWYAFSPLLFDEVVTETLTEAQTVATGQFRDADSAHRGMGTATLVQLPVAWPTQRQCRRSGLFDTGGYQCRDLSFGRDLVRTVRRSVLACRPCPTILRVARAPDNKRP